jgi:hypothetical protein
MLMRRLLWFFLFALTLPAQTPPLTLDKPPQDIDDALRARIKRFYDYYIAGKPRLCEELILEESKDDFYAMSKPDLQSYKIGNIEYSENFTKAKVLIVGNGPVVFPMVGVRIMDKPFASFWTQENGAWFWYYNKKGDNLTPFGPKTSPGPKAADGVSSAPASPDLNPEALLRSLQSALKIDRTRVDLAAGKPQTLKVTNTLPGAASLSIACPLMPLAQLGITAAFDKKDLKGNETAILTLSADPKMRPGAYPLQIMVTPTNQVLDLTVNVTP